MTQPKRTEPSMPSTDPRFIWRSSADTDVQRTWRRFGWTPTSEARKQEAA